MGKLTREDKIEIYERRKKGEIISSLMAISYVFILNEKVEYLNQVF